MISFKKVNKTNFESFLDLNSGPEGIKHCAKPCYTLMEAVFDKSLDKVQGIYQDDQLVGMFHYYFISVKRDKIWINRFMLDEKYQNKGIGRKAIVKLLEYLKTTHKEVERIECSISNPVLLNLDDKKGFIKMNNSRSNKFYEKHKEQIFYLDVN